MRLVAVSGSLRAASYNTALLRAAQTMAPDDVEMIEASIRDIPLYDGDLERDQGLPQAVVALKDLIADCDGLLLFTPEYNSGIPGVFKNAIDWLSRPASDIERVFGGRPVAVLGASPGPLGTAMSQAAWLPVLRTLGTAPWFGGRLMVPQAAAAFDAEGNLTDPDTRRRLTRFVAGFSDHCRTVARPG
ncbi:NADPH-dependent FMN reductase [Brevundimonas sp.]|uniref:NADPH-dependent FMN reductase n=1 Tax=Brevundimonas sp. TaxID=1871086 RepID=UPI003BACAB45